MHTVEGRLLDQYDRPVADATISVVGATAAVPDIAMISDTDGRFYLDDFPVGEYRIKIVLDDTNETVTFSVPRPSGKLNIRVQR